MGKCLKVNICGAPSSRKSTVCSGLESMLKQHRVNADTSKEYARQYINTYGVPTEMYEQLLITMNQNTRDEALAKVSQVLLSDNPAMSAYVFGKRMLMDILKREGRTEMKPSEYKLLEELHTLSVKKSNWFDLIIVFTPEDKVIRDGTRTEDEAGKLEIYNAIKGFLDVERIPYVLMSGTPDEKIKKCFDLIAERLGLFEKSAEPESIPVYETGKKEPVAHVKVAEEPKKCKFDMCWVGRCNKPTVAGSDYCEKHNNMRCLCGNQATHDCEVTMGAFVCGQPLCPECKSKHRH